MCAAVNHESTANNTASTTATKKSSSSSKKTFLCCTPCCFGLAKATNNEVAKAANNADPATTTQNGGHGSSNPFIDSSCSSEEDEAKIEDVAAATLNKTAPNSASFPSRQLAYSPGSPSTSSCPPLSPSCGANTPTHQPAKLGFLVSFLVDARGGAMKGNRGSGLRLIIPQGAVDHPTRVTCRYLRGSGERLPFPPPLMEREALASRVIEMGPPSAQFRVPVLLEVPHFASVRGGERELIVLRCDDGETWREHTTAYLQTSWQGNDEEIYADFVASTGITAAYEELDTSRVVRISCTSFPKYFAILSRIKEEVRAIGADGGRISALHAPTVQCYFPAGALQKKIKVALQVQTVPPKLLKLTCPDCALRFSPLVAIEPRRRRFHNAVQVAVPLSAATNQDSSRVRLLCSLAASSTPKATWEDVTDITPITISKGSVVFETKVSALFWAVYLEEASAEVMAGLLTSAQHLYEELMLPPYMARFVILHKPHTPHAWCDSLRVICVTDDKAEAWGEIGASHAWTTLATSEEMEITAGSTLSCFIEGGIEIANDCQLEFGYRTSFPFKPFESNYATLLVRPRKDHPKPNVGHLIVKKHVGHLKESQQEAVTISDLDLREHPDDINSLPDLEPEVYEDVPNQQEEIFNSSPVEENGKSQENASSDHENVDAIAIIEHSTETEENVIQVKEYSPNDEDDLVFIQLAS